MLRQIVWEKTDGKHYVTDAEYQELLLNEIDLSTYIKELEIRINAHNKRQDR